MQISKEKLILERGDQVRRRNELEKRKEELKRRKEEQERRIKELKNRESLHAKPLPITPVGNENSSILQEKKNNMHNRMAFSHGESQPVQSPPPLPKKSEDPDRQRRIYLASTEFHQENEKKNLEKDHEQRTREYKISEVLAPEPSSRGPIMWCGWSSDQMAANLPGMRQWGSKKYPVICEGLGAATKISTALQSNNMLIEIRIIERGIGDSGLKALSNSLHNSTKIRYFSLTTEEGYLPRLTIESVKILLESIRHMNALEELSLNKIVLGTEGSCILAEAICKMPTLREVSIIYPKIETEGWVVLGKAIRQSNISKLTLVHESKSRDEAFVRYAILQGNTNLRDVTIEEKSYSFVDISLCVIGWGLRRSTSVRTLDLKIPEDSIIERKSIEELSSGLGEAKRMEAFYFSHPLSKDELQIFKPILRGHKTLYKLGLTISDSAGINHIRDILEENVTLEKLELNTCLVDEVEPLERGLTNNHHIRKLKLTGNGEHLRPLAAGLSVNIALRILHISTRIRGDGAKLLVSALKGNTTISKLILDQVNDKVLEILVDIFEGNKYILSTKISNPWKSLEDTGLVKLAHILETKNNSLRELFLENQEVGEYGAVAFATMIEKNKSIISFNIPSFCNVKSRVGFFKTIKRSLRSNDTLRRIGNVDLDDEAKQYLIYAFRFNCCLSKLEYKKRKKPNKLTAQLLRIVEDPDRREAYLKTNAGRQQQKESNFEVAIMEYNDAIVLRPYYPSPLYHRGLCFLKMRRFEDAEDDIQKAMEFSPALRNTSRTTESITLCRQAISLKKKKKKKNLDQGNIEHKDESSPSWEITADELTWGKRFAVGSFGEVYQGIFRGTQVAIKKMLEQDPSEKEILSFQKEINMMSTLRHPNLLLLLAGCTTSPNLCIVTEYMDMGSLYSVLHKSGQVLSFERKLDISLQIVRGLLYLHLNNPPIAHRDLKPTNILVDRKWRITIADFGLTKIKERSKGMSTRAGTPIYIAPEMVKDEPYDETVDQYAFGIMLWEIMLQQKPYEGANPMQLVVSVAFKGVRPSKEHMRDLPPTLQNIIEECWDNDPNKRPHFLEVLKVLEDLQDKFIDLNE